MTKIAVNLLAVLTIASVSISCASPPNVKFYTIDTAALRPQRRAAVAPYVVIGPVTVPEVVDRPQLVVRLSDNQVTLLEQHRWAEPLKAMVPRIVASDLSHSLGVARVLLYPESWGVEPSYRVRLDIDRFESAPGKGVTLAVSWSIQRAAGLPDRSGRSVVQEPVTQTGYDALAAAHGRALARLSEELAEVIRSIGTAT